MHIFIQYLQLLRIPFNLKTVTDLFYYHSYHPSILSLSEVLNELNVPNVSLRVDKSNFHKIPTPFIAKTSSSEGDFCLIKKIDNDKIVYINEKEKQVHTTITNFFKQYSGVVLVAEPNNNSGEINYLLNKKNYLLNKLIGFLLIILITFILIISVVNKINYLYLYFVFILQIIGLIISILLIITSLQFNNQFINKFCSNNTGNGCHNILNSPKAFIFNGKISLSEIGLFYFISSLASFIINPTTNTHLLFIINLFCVGFSFYSIYYQKFIVKQWCKLCVLIQCVFWVQLLISIFWGALNFYYIHFYQVFIFTFIFLMVGLIWFYIKPTILKLQQYPSLIKSINKFKTNPIIFNTLLQDENKITPLEDKYKIILINSNANFEILLILNPYCIPCLEKYKIIEKEIIQKKLDCKLSIVFQYDSFGKDIVQSIISTYIINGAQETEICLSNWFNKKYSLNNFLKKYPFLLENKQVNEILYNQEMWCYLNEINDTPNFYINNNKLPSEYNIQDIKYYIELK